MANLINKKLASKLIRMAAKEQKLRWQAVAVQKEPQEVQQKVWKKIAKVDNSNQEEFKKIIKKYGFPTLQMVGKRGFRSAWLIAQHYDRDKSFQKRTLNLMESLYKENPRSIIPSNLAYLRDRVLVNAGKKQIYGTQFILNQKTKTYEPKPIRNIKEVPKLRKQMGIKETLLQNQKKINKINK